MALDAGGGRRPPHQEQTHAPQQHRPSPRRRAAVGARAAKATRDPTKREVPTDLQNWRVNLAHRYRMAEQIAKLEAIYADLVRFACSVMFVDASGSFL
jgi:hypothetical protein